MVRAIALAALLCFAVPVAAGTWSGVLVDAACYASEERNINPDDTNPHADRDMDREIRYCSPDPKTKAFAVVEDDWGSFDLDPGGNSQAAALVRKAGKRALYRVTVTGRRHKNRVDVDSIVLSR